MLKPDKALWIFIDSQLLTCLMASISPQILPQVLGLDQSNRVWNNLEKRFSSLSSSHIHDLKTSLYSLKKTSTIEAYVAHKLVVTGSVLDEEELVYYTLNECRRYAHE